MQWAQIVQTDPALGMLVAEMRNISPSYVRRYLQTRQAFLEQAALAAGPGAPGTTPPKASPNGNGIPAPIANRMNGSLQGASGGVGSTGT